MSTATHTTSSNTQLVDRALAASTKLTPLIDAREQLLLALQVVNAQSPVNADHKLAVQAQLLVVERQLAAHKEELEELEAELQSIEDQGLEVKQALIVVVLILAVVIAIALIRR